MGNQRGGDGEIKRGDISGIGGIEQWEMWKERSWEEDMVKSPRCKGIREKASGTETHHETLLVDSLARSLV